MKPGVNLLRAGLLLLLPGLLGGCLSTIMVAGNAMDQAKMRTAEEQRYAGDKAGVERGDWQALQHAMLYRYNIGHYIPDEEADALYDDASRQLIARDKADLTPGEREAMLAAYLWRFEHQLRQTPYRIDPAQVNRALQLAGAAGLQTGAYQMYVRLQDASAAQLSSLRTQCYDMVDVEEGIRGQTCMQAFRLLRSRQDYQPGASMPDDGVPQADWNEIWANLDGEFWGGTRLDRDRLLTPAWRACAAHVKTRQQKIDCILQGTYRQWPQDARPGQ